MEDTDYIATTSASMTAANMLHKDIGLDLPSWDTISISHVLLPVLCAIFIAVVVIVIACCLIQKKSKSSGVLRQKSSHTIETLHEASEQDIYDVIDELRVKNLSPDKCQGRQSKVDYNGLLTSSFNLHSKLSNVFTNKQTAAISCECTSKFDLLTSKMCVRNSREWMRKNKDVPPNDARLSTNTDGGSSSVADQDDGIYETLDRHWTLKNDRSVYHHQEKDSHGSFQTNIHEPSSMDTNVNMNKESEWPSSQNSRELQPKVESPGQHDSTRKLVCQINMFEFINEESKPALLETTYYQIQPQISPKSGDVFQKTNLRIVQENMKETNPNANLLLKHLKEDEVLLHKLAQPFVRKNSQLAKSTKMYEKLHKSNSKRVPTILIKKSESFRTTPSEPHAAKEKHRISRRKSDSSDMEPPLVNARVPTRHAHISAGPEATRILTKLGPLPPVPPSCQVTHPETKSQSGARTESMDTSSSETDITQGSPTVTSSSLSSLIKKYSTSSNTDSETGDQLAAGTDTTNSFRCPSADVPSGNSNPEVILRTEFPRESSTACATEYDVDPAVDRSNFKKSNLPPAVEGQGSYLDDTSSSSVCRVIIEPICDNVSLDPEDGDSNYYFVLESTNSVSGSNRNSDACSASDCYEAASTQIGETLCGSGEREEAASTAQKWLSDA